MHETLYQTAEAGISQSDSGCKSISIRQRMQENSTRQPMQETLYQTADAETSYQTADAGDTFRQSLY